MGKWKVDGNFYLNDRLPPGGRNWKCSTGEAHCGWLVFRATMFAFKREAFRNDVHWKDCGSTGFLQIPFLFCTFWRLPVLSGLVGHAGKAVVGTRNGRVRPHVVNDVLVECQLSRQLALLCPRLAFSLGDSIFHDGPEKRMLKLEDVDHDFECEWSSRDISAFDGSVHQALLVQIALISSDRFALHRQLAFDLADCWYPTSVENVELKVLLTLTKGHETWLIDYLYLSCVATIYCLLRIVERDSVAYVEHTKERSKPMCCVLLVGGGYCVFRSTILLANPPGHLGVDWFATDLFYLRPYFGILDFKPIWSQVWEDHSLKPQKSLMFRKCIPAKQTTETSSGGLYHQSRQITSKFLQPEFVQRILGGRFPDPSHHLFFFCELVIFLRIRSHGIHHHFSKSHLWSTSFYFV